MSGCMSVSSWADDPLKMTTDATAMRSEVLRFISIGMRVEDAKEIMEKHGFACAFEEEKGFMQDDAVSGKLCLVCSKYPPESKWIHFDKMVVYALFEGGVIKDIVIRHFSDCL
jgi:hypothetical protein